MSEFTIESNVPVPPRRGPGAYPWADMKPGDSILISGSQSKSAISNAHKFAKENAGAKFASRKEDDGARVWRLS